MVQNNLKYPLSQLPIRKLDLLYNIPVLSMSGLEHFQEKIISSVIK